MLQRFLTLGQIPEIRSEPSPPDRETPEVEVLMPVEAYWEVQQMIHEIRYTRSAGMSGTKQWQKFNRLIAPFIVAERDRLWFAKSNSL